MALCTVLSQAALMAVSIRGRGTCNRPCNARPIQSTIHDYHTSQEIKICYSLRLRRFGGLFLLVLRSMVRGMWRVACVTFSIFAISFSSFIDSFLPFYSYDL